MNIEKLNTILNQDGTHAEKLVELTKELMEQNVYPGKTEEYVKRLADQHLMIAMEDEIQFEQEMFS